MKKITLFCVLVSALIVGGLTGCTSTLVVKADDVLFMGFGNDPLLYLKDIQYHYYKLRNKPGYENLRERLKVGGPFTIYHDPYNTITKIEGLMPIEEYNALMAKRAADEAQKKAEQAAEADAKRKTLEEANKYDPSKFTVVPSDFKPAEYTSVDLFKAVSEADKLTRSPENKAITIRSTIGRGFYSLARVSDLTFVRQDGTNITFSSDDKAITQIMTIDQRSGLQAGQKVRVYYIITKAPLTSFDVVAIERR